MEYANTSIRLPTDYVEQEQVRYHMQSQTSWESTVTVALWLFFSERCGSFSNDRFLLQRYSLNYPPSPFSLVAFSSFTVRPRSIARRRRVPGGGHLQKLTSPSWTGRGTIAIVAFLLPPPTMHINNYYYPWLLMHTPPAPLFIVRTSSVDKTRVWLATQVWCSPCMYTSPSMPRLS